MKNLKISVIGAGISGLITAHHLSKKYDVQVFEKAKGPGGRMATRTSGPFQFDFGAQFFVAKSDPFKNFLRPFQEKNILEAWCPKFVEIESSKIKNAYQWHMDNKHFICQPKMSQLCKALAKDCQLSLNTQISAIRKEADVWALYSGDTLLGQYDWVISAIPVAQAVALLPPVFRHYETIKKIKMLGCYALMLGFDNTFDLDWEAALVKGHDLSWISINHSKPGRQTYPSIVALSTNKWADDHMEDDLADVKAHMKSEVLKHVQYNEKAMIHEDIHRWRYANILKQDGPKSFFDLENRLAAVGDWCVRGFVEGAFKSANDFLEKFNFYVRK